MTCFIETLSTSNPTLIWIGLGVLMLISVLLILMSVELSRYRRRLISYEKELADERVKVSELLALTAVKQVEEEAKSDSKDEPKVEEDQVVVETDDKQEVVGNFVGTEIYEDYVDGSMTHNDRIFLQRLTSYIEQHLDSSELAVNRLCDFMGVTPLVLNKKLKILVDMTANVYIRTIRLRRAAQLLRTARYTVADVTYDVGFSDLRYFRECFKKEFGVLPQEYKDQHSNTTERERIRPEVDAQ